MKVQNNTRQQLLILLKKLKSTPFGLNLWLFKVFARRLRNN